MCVDTSIFCLKIRFGSSFIYLTLFWLDFFVSLSLEVVVEICPGPASCGLCGPRRRRCCTSGGVLRTARRKGGKWFGAGWGGQFWWVWELFGRLPGCFVFVFLAFERFLVQYRLKASVGFWKFRDVWGHPGRMSFVFRFWWLRCGEGGCCGGV